MKESQCNQRVSSLFARNAVVEAQSRFEQWQWFEQFQEFQEYSKWRERKTSPEACGVTQTSNVMIKSPTPVSRLDTSNLIQTGTAVIHSAMGCEQHTSGQRGACTSSHPRLPSNPVFGREGKGVGASTTPQSD